MVLNPLARVALLALLSVGCKTGQAPDQAQSQQAPAPQGLVVHEWGTFTVLVGPDRQQVGWVNTDDEPVPDFVHRSLARMVSPTDFGNFMQGAPRCLPDATVRLETPVIYFHLPQGVPSAQVDVTVDFVGGWLTEVFPGPSSEGIVGQEPGLLPPPHGPIDPAATWQVTWRDLTLGQVGTVPETDDPVWLAPRAVDAAPIRTSAGVGEQFLFYRGIGNLDVPVSVTQSDDGKQVQLAGRAGAVGAVPASWLLDVTQDGAGAWVRGPELSLQGDPVLMSAELGPARADAATSLMADMKTALIADGLFADEAQALLETWRDAYFEAPGRRVFLLLPQDWTDQVLPLSVTGDLPTAGVERVMVGRFELITPELQAQVDAIPGLGPPDRMQAYGVMLGHSVDGEPVSALPADYAAFLALGRFRNALVLRAQTASADPRWDRFVGEYSLGGAR